MEQRRADLSMWSSRAALRQLLVSPLESLGDKYIETWYVSVSKAENIKWFREKKKSSGEDGCSVFGHRNESVAVAGKIFDGESIFGWLHASLRV